MARTMMARARAHRRRRCDRVRVQWVRQVQVGQLRAHGTHSSEMGRQLYADNRRAHSSRACVELRRSRGGRRLREGWSCT